MIVSLNYRVAKKLPSILVTVCLISKNTNLELWTFGFWRQSLPSHPLFDFLHFLRHLLEGSPDYLLYPHFPPGPITCPKTGILLHLGKISVLVTCGRIWATVWQVSTFIHLNLQIVKFTYCSFVMEISSNLSKHCGGKKINRKGNIVGKHSLSTNTDNEQAVPCFSQMASPQSYEFQVSHLTKILAEEGSHIKN